MELREVIFERDLYALLPKPQEVEDRYDAFRKIREQILELEFGILNTHVHRKQLIAFLEKLSTLVQQKGLQWYYDEVWAPRMRLLKEHGVKIAEYDAKRVIRGTPPPAPIPLEKSEKKVRKKLRDPFDLTDIVERTEKVTKNREDAKKVTSHMKKWSKKRAKNKVEDDFLNMMDWLKDDE